jgi:CheY-like chemotaxis protein
MPRTILLVDDDPLARDLLSRRPARAGCRTVTATDGERAVRLAHQELPAPILMDVSLP